MSTDDEEFVQEKDIQVIYVATFKIGYDTYKFVVDFGSTLPADDTPKFTTRIIMSPDSARAFVNAFELSIKEYAERFQ